MRKIFALNMILILGVFMSCQQAEEVTELEFGERKFSGVQSESAFSATLHPILVRNCAGCHGDNGSMMKHSVSDASKAHGILMGGNKVNLESPSSSSIISKVKNGHNCWSNCSSNASEIENAIQSWANLASNKPGVPNPGPGPIPNPGPGENSNFDRVKSASRFATTVHPILAANCMACHGGANPIQAPFHAVPDTQVAHNAVIDAGKVNFIDVSNSRLVKRLSNDSHYCWDQDGSAGADCALNAQSMTEAINDWNGLNIADGNPYSAANNGAVTVSLGLSNAEIRIAETVNGTILLQAEDGLIEGRFKKKSDSFASNFSYITGDAAGGHPIEGTPRAASVNGNCNVVTAADLAKTTDGRYRLSETKRHIKDDGYRYYSQLVKIRIIRPHMRAQYAAAVKAGTPENQLQKYYLTNSGPDDRNVPDGILDGNPEVRTIAPVLPEFLSHSEYVTKINSQNITYKDFFAPRFGNTGTEYFTANNVQIRANLPDYLKTSGVWTSASVYGQLRSRFYEYFHDFRNGAWDYEDNIRSVPVTLRTMPDGMGGTIKFKINDNESSKAFMAYYWGALTATNALDPISGTDSTALIDSYVHYTMDNNDRDFNDFSWNYKVNGTDVRDNFDLNRGTELLNLKNLYSGAGGNDPRSISVQNYSQTLKPILVSNCVGCHGDGSGRPQFAQANNNEAFDVIAGYIDFANPANSVPPGRMFNDRHNCGNATTCNNLGNQMVQAITDWNTQNIADAAAAQSAQNDGRVILTDAQRSPGRASYKIKIGEAGDYNVWVKVKGENNQRDISIRILDNQNRPMRNCNANQSCTTSEATFANSTAAAIENMSCVAYDPGTNTAWTWYTPSIGNVANRRKWSLPEGEYTVQIVEREIGAKIDMIAISKNPEFNPRENLIDEGFITDIRPKVLKYDLQAITGEVGSFEIEIKEKESGDAYIFRNPRFVGAANNLKFKNIKIFVNNQYEFANSTYTELDRVAGANSGILTYASLVALQLSGPQADVFAFTFEDLTPTQAAAEVILPDVPVPVVGRKCLKLPLFEGTVMPILNRFRLMLKADYEDYTADDFPGRNSNDATNPTFYNCTTCHNEQHPYFKMTTFFNNSAVLCEQALSRVDFGSFEKSLLLRGINGTFNHPKLHFVENVGTSGSGDSATYRKDANKVNGFDSSWLGIRFEKYAQGTGPDQINLTGQTGDNLAYLRKFIGQYKRVKYRTIDDPFSADDGEIKTVNTTYDAVTEEWTIANGLNEYTIANPGDYLNNKAAFNPASPGGDFPIKVKDTCIEKNFDTANGVTSDPCNNNVNVTAEFESIKANYRNAVINWMAREKAAYDAANGN